jgi:hypothetical protein
MVATFLMLCAVPVGALTIYLDDGGENFGPGDTLNLSIGVANPDAVVTVDAYLLLILPDQTWLFFQLDGSGNLIPLPGTTDPTTWTKLLSNVTLTAGLDTGAVPVLSYTFTGSEPTGMYQWILAFMNAGTLDLLGYEIEPFMVGTYPLANVIGTWSGSWTNQTFGSTGSANFEIVDSSPGVVTITVDLGGNVFGGVDPPAFTVTATLDSEGNITITGESPVLGTLNIIFNTDGTFTGTVESIPAAGIDSTNFSGTVSNGVLTLNYTVNFSNNTQAVGILTATRQ